MSNEEVRLVEAAVKLGASYNQTLRWVLLGRLKGVRRDGRWFVSAADVERMRAERAHEHAEAAR
jgi:predicted site-specific integrase-resolvase